MIEEYARVLACDGSFAEVETQRLPGCGNCGQKAGCGTSLLGRFFGNRSVRLRVLNRIGAQPGEQVVLGLREQALLNASFAVYAAPIVCLVAGAVLGQSVSFWFDPDARELSGILGGLLGLSGALVWLRRFTTRRGNSDNYQAVILRRTEFMDRGHIGNA